MKKKKRLSFFFITKISLGFPSKAVSDSTAIPYSLHACDGARSVEAVVAFVHSLGQEEEERGGIGTERGEEKRGVKLGGGGKDRGIRMGKGGEVEAMRWQPLSLAQKFPCLQIYQERITTSKPNKA